MTTDRSLLMRVLTLPHGSSDNELDTLCRDILAHTSTTVRIPIVKRIKELLKR